MSSEKAGVVTTKDQLLKHFDYSLDTATHKCKYGDYEHAIAHLRNGIENLNQLQSIKNEQEQLDKAHFILKQIEADRIMNEQLVGVYERQGN